MSNFTGMAADRVRIEVEADGETRIVELVAGLGGKVSFSLDLDCEIRERNVDLIAASPWKEFEPSGRMRVRLKAFGVTTTVGNRRGAVGELDPDHVGVTRIMPDEPAGQSEP